MFVVICTVDFYIYVFMTCYIFYCLCDTLMDPWNACMYICMYVDTGHQAAAKKILGRACLMYQ